jgi:hypothetical protein
MSTSMVAVGVGVAPTSAAATMACVTSVTTCRGTIMSGVTYARACGWIAGFNSTSAELEVENGRLSGTMSDGVPKEHVARCRIPADNVQRRSCIAYM